MDVLREVLTQVREGKTSFQPTGPSEDEIRAFQPIAKALVYADKRDYLRCRALREHRTSNSFYINVYVVSGLTYQGELFLENAPQPLQSEAVSVDPTGTPPPQEDIFDFKPNFLGFGVNLNALWRWFRKRGRS